MHRDSNRSQTPTGPEEEDSLEAVGQLPSHSVAAPHAPRPQGAGHGRHLALESGGRQAGAAVDDLVAGSAGG